MNGNTASSEGTHSMSTEYSPYMPLIDKARPQYSLVSPLGTEAVNKQPILVKGRNRIVSGLNLEMGAHALSIAEKKDLCRLTSSESKAREVTKRKREVDRRAKKRREEDHVEIEGVVYEAGAF